ncbi:MAG TPA: beta-galactosidase [bacterium]|mgnify:CR=1 FL=1|nr:beta-galactosidase [bacterium]HPG44318.1 beta-galactosidase [bacterium]HPM96685.1 beta-galactosidase [bacterium]
MNIPNQKKILYGGDYNPEQWPREIWHKDIRMFKRANIDIVTLPVFSWALLQPSEERYDFQWLDEITDLLTTNGIRICMATSTAVHPAWMAKAYPDVLRVDFEGRKHKFGQRHNSCPNSPTYRRYSRALAAELAQHYKALPSLAVWHVSNEYGGECYCENCEQEFRKWLRARYGSLDELNKRWVTRFWGHTFYDWDEIVLPNALSEFWDDGTRTAFQGIALDYRRFMSDSLLACYRNEYEVLKQITPAIPITTNLMGTFKGLDYFAWAPYLDMVSWDNYPLSTDGPANMALRHELMRGLKGGQPFMLMEQTPSQQNWQPYNELKRPGVMRLWSYQAVAHGADTVMFFQLRRSQGACEKYHGAVIEHCGHENTRVFTEVAELGKELASLGDAILGARQDAKAAILFDWENWWAVELSSGPSVDLKYIPQIQKYYQAFFDLHIPVDVVSPLSDLGKYRILVAPLAYMLQPGFAAKVESFVQNGGTFLTTFFSGIVDENDRVVLGGYPAELRKVLGIWAEEIDALFPDTHNKIVIKKNLGSLSGSYRCSLLCDLIHAEGAEVLAEYGSDFYAGRPVLTRNRFGRGTAWYVATDPEPSFLDGLIGHICTQTGIKGLVDPVVGLEVTERSSEKDDFVFMLNHNANPVKVDLGDVRGTELLSKNKLKGVLEMPGRAVWIIRRDQKKR